MSRPVGVDLGTTNSVVAVLEGGEPSVITNSEGQRTTPSVVAFAKNNEVLVGEVAKRQAVQNADRTIRSVKRHMGTNWTVNIDGKDYTAQEISARVLQKLKRDAEAYLGESVTDAVITVPAYFNDAQRQATKEAGEIAGFNVLRIINEPTAAALAYGLDKGDKEQTILVFDLGGGTFDVSVLELHGNVFQVIASGGDTFLGGADFDAAIIQFVLQSFLDEHRIDLSEDPVVLQRIASAAEAAKVDLSLLSNVVIQLPYVTEKKGKPLDLNISLSRERLNLLTKDLVDRSIEVCDQVLKEAGIATTDVDEIILVGGQTRMPLVQGTIHQHFGRPARKGIHPDECVALGAALLADSLEQLDAVTLVDAVSLPIGIALPSGAFKVVVPGNSNIPSEHVLEVPAAAAKTGFSLDIFQGEGARVVENEYLGGVKVPAGVAKVIFRLDEECLLHVAHEDAGGARAETTIVTKDAPEALKEAWREEVERRRATVTEQGGAPDDRVGVMASIWKVFGRD